MSSYVSLNGQAHGDLRVNHGGGYAFAANSHLVSLVLHEFAKACVHYPIVFVRSSLGSRFRPMALLGLEPSRNAFVDANGQWAAGHYVPAAFRRHPFALTQTGTDLFSVCVDTESPLVSSQEGERLFDEQGRPLPALLKIRDFLGELAHSEALAEQFCDRLVDMDLLVPVGLHVRHSEQVLHHEGAFVVSEDRLSSLGDGPFLALREQGFLSAVYAHLISLQQLERLQAIRAGQA